MGAIGRFPEVRFARCDDERLAALAPSAWRAKAEKMCFARERRQELVAGGLLSEMLASRGITSPRFFVDPFGKPHLEPPSVCFSLSHSDELVMVTVADVEVGCDVEKVVLEDGRDLSFYANWTRREAGLKMSGCGFATGAAADAPPHPLARNVPAPEGYSAAVCFDLRSLADARIV